MVISFLGWEDVGAVVDGYANKNKENVWITTTSHWKDRFVYDALLYYKKTEQIDFNLGEIYQKKRSFWFFEDIKPIIFG